MNESLSRLGLKCPRCGRSLAHPCVTRHGKPTSTHRARLRLIEALDAANVQKLLWEGMGEIKR